MGWWPRNLNTITGSYVNLKLQPTGALTAGYETFPCATYTYDSGGNPKRLRFKYWNGSSWILPADIDGNTGGDYSVARYQDFDFTKNSSGDSYFSPYVVYTYDYDPFFGTDSHLLKIGWTYDYNNWATMTLYDGGADNVVSHVACKGGNIFGHADATYMTMIYKLTGPSGVAYYYKNERYNGMWGAPVTLASNVGTRLITDDPNYWKSLTGPVSGDERGAMPAVDWGYHPGLGGITPFYCVARYASSGGTYGFASWISIVWYDYFSLSWQYMNIDNDGTGNYLLEYPSISIRKDIPYKDVSGNWNGAVQISWVKRGVGVFAATLSGSGKQQMTINTTVGQADNAKWTATGYKSGGEAYGQVVAYTTNTGGMGYSVTGYPVTTTILPFTQTGFRSTKLLFDTSNQAQIVSNANYQLFYARLMGDTNTGAAKLRWKKDLSTIVPLASNYSGGLEGPIHLKYQNSAARQVYLVKTGDELASGLKIKTDANTIKEFAIEPQL